MSCRVLLTGASGLLGRALYSELSSQPGLTVTGTCRSRDHDGTYRKLDLTNHDQVQQLLQDVQPTVIVHAAAERRPDVMEQKEEESRELNVSATRRICEEAKSLPGCWVVYISTDYVFDGSEPPYCESAEKTNPLNKYGRSKLDGELECLQVSPENAVLRVPILYGDVEHLAESAVTILFDKVQSSGEDCVMSDYERRYPTYCRDLAVVIRQMIQQHSKNPDLGGYFHWSGDEEMTKYDMAVCMARIFSLPSYHIQPDKTPSTGTKRPYNCQLQCRRLKEFGIGRQTSFKVAIEKCLEMWTSSSGGVKVKIHVD